jgi:hypothetical protein
MTYLPMNELVAKYTSLQNIYHCKIMSSQNTYHRAHVTSYKWSFHQTASQKH